MNKKSYIKNKLLIILLALFVLLIIFLVYRISNSSQDNFINKKLIDRNSQTIIESNKSLSDDPELYKDPYNYPYLIGGPIIKDIDNDGKIEKIIRYNLSMADRPIQVLYIYRNIDDEYKLIKAFYGDPYGFARMVDDNTIIVGRFLPVDDGLKNWDDFSQFEITKYQWTKNGEIKLNQEIVNSTSTNNLSEEIRNHFYPDVSSLTYNQVLNSKIDPERSPTLHDSSLDGYVVEWNAKISSYYSQITGIKFCVIDDEHKNIDIDKPCDWFWAFNDTLMGADDTEASSGWDGHWVDFILNYYKVPFNENRDFYKDIYTIKGVVNGIDCGVGDKCVPNIDIISIIK